MKLVLTGLHKTILFHLFLWSIWLYLSLSNVGDDEFYGRAKFVLILIITTHIPLFIINTEWLIPVVLIRKGIPLYLASLAVVIFGFILLHQVVHSSLEDHPVDQHVHHGPRPSKGTVALILVAAISTGYGLLNYVVVQEKQQQEKQKERLQSELSFLRSQISPHFIFNILNSIVYLIRTKSDLAEPVTLKLSELMRYMLYESENAQIPLEKEVAYLKNYIELQQVRFGEDVDIVFDTKEEAGSQMIEPMLLIPFVENAFKHGVGMVLNPSIKIVLHISENTLSFSVKNKIAPEMAPHKDTSSGIGLKNVQRRLELLYPETHELLIQDEKDWFLVTLLLKFN